MKFSRLPSSAPLLLLALGLLPAAAFAQTGAAGV
jgi:hypothetical protein